MEVNVSGSIWAKPDSNSSEGETYMIRSENGAGWGLLVRDLNPEDLRVLADRIETKRAQNNAYDTCGCEELGSECPACEVEA